MANTIKWYFWGPITEVYRYSGGEDFNIGDRFVLGFEFDGTKLPTSGAYGSGGYGQNYSHYTNAITKVTAENNGMLLLASSYRFQRLTIANGLPGDYVEIDLDGGIDNYGTLWGQNLAGEFIDIYGHFTDLDRVVFDSWNVGGFTPVPDSLPFAEFEGAYFQYRAEDATGAVMYSLRVRPDHFSTSPPNPVPEPSSWILAGTGLMAIAGRGMGRKILARLHGRG